MATLCWCLVTDVITWEVGLPQGLSWSRRTPSWECVCEYTHVPPLLEEDALRPLPESARSSFPGDQQSLQGSLTRSAN